MISYHCVRGRPIAEQWVTRASIARSKAEALLRELLDAAGKRTAASVEVAGGAGAGAGAGDANHGVHALQSALLPFGI